MSTLPTECSVDAPSPLRASPEGSPLRASPEGSLATDSPDLLDALRDRLTSRQLEVFRLRYIAERKVSTIAAILRLSVSSIEKELKAARLVRDELCAGAIANEEALRTQITIVRGHRLQLANNNTLRAVITGMDRRRLAVARET